ncbi:MAG: O-antigen ligase family protein [Chloroflexi bacterium]|nr:O-antigen ligase family protein [Chloroflexota bacterium]
MALLYRNTLITLTAIWTTACAAAAIGAIFGSGRLSLQGMMLLLGGIALGPVALVVLLRPGVGTGLLPLVAAVVPLSIGTGTQSPLVAALLFAMLLTALWIVRGALTRNLVLVRSPVVAPTIVLMLIWIVAFLVSSVNRPALVWLWDAFFLPRLGQLGVVLVSAFVLLLALNTGRDLHWLAVATWTLIICGAVAVAAFFFHAETAIRFLSTGGLFTMWGISLAYGQALFNGGLSRWLRLALIGLVIAWLIKALVMQSIWFSGWLPALVVVLVLTLLRSRIAFAGVVAVGAVWVFLNQSTVQYVLYTQKVEEGDLTRAAIWAQAWELVHAHPILGTGPAGYAAYYMSVFPNSQYSMSTHSNYMDILVETGVVGAFAFGWFFLALLRAGWTARRRWPSGFVGGVAQSSFAGIFGVLAAMMLGDWFIPFVYNQTIAGFRYTMYSWLFFGYLAALAAQPTGTQGRPAAEPEGEIGGSIDYRSELEHPGAPPSVPARGAGDN